MSDLHSKSKSATLPFDILLMVILVLFATLLLTACKGNLLTIDHGTTNSTVPQSVQTTRAS
jgi:hypothetical protein